VHLQRRYFVPRELNRTRLYRLRGRAKPNSSVLLSSLEGSISSVWFGSPTGWSLIGVPAIPAITPRDRECFRSSLRYQKTSTLQHLSHLPRQRLRGERFLNKIQTRVQYAVADHGIFRVSRHE
jgi:hypothetical protein